MRARIGILLFVGVASVGSLFWLNRPASSRANVSDLPLSVPAERLDAGDLWETPSHTVELPVRITYPNP